MNDFLSTANCNGVQPRDVISNTLYSRPRLVGALLKRRDCLRLILAPPKYGKKYVAAEYAKLVFNFNDTLWLNCKSPLFLRDLDAGILFEPIFNGKIAAKLIVLADLPLMEDKRFNDLFSGIDTLMKMNIEVIVTSSPKLRGKVPESIESSIVNSYDLVVTFDEMKNTINNCSSVKFNMESNFASIAPRVWDFAFRNIYLEKDIEHQSLESKAVKFLAYLLVNCEIDDVQDLLDDLDVASVFFEIERYEPHILVDTQARAIKTERESLEDVINVFREFLINDLHKLISSENHEFYSKIATILFKNNESKRALAFVKLFMKPNEAILWLKKNLEFLLERGHCGESLVMLKDLSVRNVEDVSTRMFLEFIFYFHTNQVDKCFDLGDTILRIPSAPLNLQVLAMALLSVFADKERSFDSVSKLCALHQNSVRMIKSCPDLSDFYTSSRIAMICELVEIIYDDLFKALVYLVNTVEKKSKQKNFSNSDEVFLHYLIYLFFECFLQFTNGVNVRKNTMRAMISKSGTRESASTLLKYLIEFLYEGATLNLSSNTLNIHSIMALRAARDVTQSLAKKYRISMPQKIEFVVDSYASILYDDMKHTDYLCNEDKVNENIVSFSKEKTHELLHQKYSSTSQLSPMLKVGLFGNLTFSVGENRIEATFERRKKAILLIALLAINKGKELSRNEIMSVLWENDKDRKISNANNLYTLISSINKFFEEACGTKYIAKSRYGYWFEPNCISSDYDTLTNICRSMFYGEFSSCDWREIIETINQDFSDSFLKQVNNNEYINKKRKLIDMMLADSLVAGGQKLLHEGEYRGCSEFAKEALSRDVAREDAYHLLISAQSKLEQRSAAIQTFFACKENLNSILGLDPSNSIKDIYKRVLEM